MDPVYAFLLLLGPLTGGLLSYFLTTFSLKKYIKLWLAFSGAYLLALTLSNLLPHVFEHSGDYTGHFLLAGFLFQVILDFFSKGADHGHMHRDDDHDLHFPFSLFIALCLHSFIEGIPLGSGIIHEPSSERSFLWGIILHEAPAGFVLVSILKANGLGRNTLLGILLLYACMSPAGFFISSFAGNSDLFQENTLHYILAAVSGTFLHISTTILFESSENHKFNSTKLLMIALGIVLSLLLR